MKLYLIISFLFVSATGYTQQQEKDLNSDKLSAPDKKEDFSDDWANLASDKKRYSESFSSK